MTDTLEPQYAHFLFALLIVVLALVQSMFGVGLLIFGTPTLLFVGLPFEQVLSILLPASLTVSVLQIACDGKARGDYIGSFLRYTLPALALGLLLALVTRLPGFDLAICALLVVAAVLRTSDACREMLMVLARRYSRAMLLAIGLVHGVTNMGGSLLEIHVSSRETEKLAIRQGIACGYALLAGSQLLVLAVAGRLHLSLATGTAVVLAASVFLTLGRRTFSGIRQAEYRGLVSLLMLLAATALVAKRAVA